jgi:hypothetical protein
MSLLVILLIAGMVLFAIVTAFREALQYNRALQGDLQYLVSKQRRNRRLLISFLLLLEALFLFLGFFVIPSSGNALALLFWLSPIALILIVVYLSLQDWRETRRDVDLIFKEAYRTALKKIESSKSEIPNVKQIGNPKFKS